MVAKNRSQFVILRHFKFRVERIPTQGQNDRVGICRNFGTWLLEPIHAIAKSKFRDFRPFSKILPLTKVREATGKTGKFYDSCFFVVHMPERFDISASVVGDPRHPNQQTTQHR
jgi:hypothetical protein